MKKTQEIKVIFMGTSHFAFPILEMLFKEKYNIVGVYTHPGVKFEDEKKAKQTMIEDFAQKNNLRVFEIDNFNEEKVEELASLNCDLVVVAAYGKILPEFVLKVPPFGCLNVHPSLLPKFRGPAPIQNTLLAGEEESGTTIILMNKGVDTGDILAQEKISISSNEVNPEVSKKLSELSANLLKKTLPLWLDKKITPVPQDNSKAILCQLIEREDGRIIWDDDAVSIYNRWRAFFGWPGVYAFWERGERMIRVKLEKISLPEKKSGETKGLGEIFSDDEGLKIATGSGEIILLELQIEGKERVSAKDFINGYPDFIGSVLK